MLAIDWFGGLYWAAWWGGLAIAVSLWKRWMDKGKNKKSERKYRGYTNHL